MDDDEYLLIHEDCQNGSCEHCDFPVWRCLCIPVCHGSNK